MYAGYGFGRPWTPGVRALILALGAGYLAQLLASRAAGIEELLGLDTGRPLEAWRWASYALLHGGPFHLLFNALAIWMFGTEVEERLGTPRFAAFCAVAGVGAALSVIAVDRLLGRESLVIGASGVVFGLLLAYGTLFAERVITLLVFFVLPVSLKAKHFVVVFGAVELLFGMSGGTQVAHFAHLGGMLFAWLFLRASGPSPARRAGGPGVLEALRDRLGRFTRARDERRMDELLRKVNDRGIGSLTAGEKQFLHRMSRRKRWN